MSINFHLPNFTDTFSGSLNISIAMMIKDNPELFYDGVRVASVSDSLPLKWNGGQIVAGYIEKGSLDRVTVSMVTRFNKAGIPCRHTFTNPVLDEDDLDDYHCRRVLDLTDNGFNQAEVLMPMVEERIRALRPNMPLVSSSLKGITDYDGICAELEKDYKYVCLDPSVSRDFELLEKLPHKEKCIITVNSSCEKNCPRRCEHYEFIGKFQRSNCNPQALEAIRSGWAKLPSWNCPLLKQTAFTRREAELHITPQEIYGRYADMGFENFALEGRGLNSVDLAEQYVYYMVKPEYADPVRYSLLVPMINAAKG